MKMISTTQPFHKRASIRLLTVAVLILLSLCRPQPGQSRSVTDPSTPTGMAPGAPAGSYVLSGFENVNPYNGRLSFHLPLLKAGGRGDAQMSMMLDVEQVWRAVHAQFACGNGGTGICYSDYPTYNLWDSILPGYGPGVVQLRTSDDDQCVGFEGITQTLARITFTAPDGTEHELRDQKYQGQPITNYCNLPNLNEMSRGRVFVSSDGPAATFIFDAAWYDLRGGAVLSPTGYLFLRDGTRYRVVNGLIQTMTDRNGNVLTFTYDTQFSRVTGITDSVGRSISIAYDVQDPSYGLGDRISWYVVNGAPQHTLFISKGPLDTALRSGFTTQSYVNLFPFLPDGGTAIFDPTVVTAVWLPNGKSYQFQYNSYGELARVVLPTGGAYEYDYTNALSYGEVYRRMVERRVYANGSTLEGKTTYSGENVFSLPNNMLGTYIDVDHLDSNGTRMARERHYYNGSGANSISGAGFPYYAPWNEGKEYQTDFLDVDGSTLLRRRQDTWEQRAHVAWWTAQQYLEPENDARITETDITLDSGQVSKQVFGYDQYNNQTDVSEYDYGSGSPARHTQTCFLTTNNACGIPLAYPYDASGLDSDNPPPASSIIHLRDLPARQSVYDRAGALASQTQYEYDSYTEGITSVGGAQHDSSFSTSYLARGNITALQRWLNSNGSWLTTRNQFDDVGNVRKTTDPRGYSTTFSFADAWGNSTCQPSGGNASAYVTSTTNALGHTTSSTFDSCLGKPLSVTDPNGTITTLAYNDALDRLTEITRASGTSIQNRTLYSYNDTTRTVTAQTDQYNFQDGGIRTETVYDGLGRVSETRQYETASSYIAVDTTYDAIGRKHTVSNPHRQSSSATDGITTYGYDALSRVLTITAPDGSVTNTRYTGNQTKTWDPANKQRRNTMDAAGRLSQVEEMQEYPSTTVYATTTYEYDALDDLTTVHQGIQTRNFVYDSLKRLTSATNPESGTTSYSVYDVNGNLMTKTDARGVSTHYTYDALNRLQTKTYDIPPGSGVAPTSAVSYCYDTATNGVGRLRAVTLGSGCTGDGSYYDAYDAMGRVKGAHQVTDGVTYGSTTDPSYEYNRAGELTAQTYPSGRKITTGYDPAGRVNSVTGEKAGEANRTYATRANYTNFWPHGAVQSMNLGNGLIESAVYNNRLQPTSIAVGSLEGFAYSYDTFATTGQHDNNGNVLSQRITTSGSPGLDVTQNYAYDAVNRLGDASETGSWHQTYTYDPNGNRTAVDNHGAVVFKTFTQAPVAEATNRITATNFQYDGAGNVTQQPDALNPSILYSYTYDAENQLSTFGVGSSTYNYSYDGDGRRVKKAAGSTATVYVYDVAGKLMAEYSNAPASASGTNFVTEDHLGSIRVVTDASGSVISRHDYLPFGETIPAGVGGRTGSDGMKYEDPDGVSQRFTEKERDSESGLDYFGARYFASMQARFMTTDLLMASADPRNPQTWNRYSYTLNNPLRFVDPDGLNPLGVAQSECEKDSSKCIKVKVVVYLSDNLTDTQKAQSTEQLSRAIGNFKKIGVEFVVTDTREVNFKSMLSPNNMDKTAINLVYGTNEDFGGVGSGSDVVNGTAGVFINIAKDRDTPTTTTFEFVQVLTWSFANRDPSGFLNAMKDWTFTGPITNALDKGSVAWPALGNLLTWGPIGGPIVNAMDWRGLYALKENAKNYQVNDQKNEGSKPRQR